MNHKYYMQRTDVTEAARDLESYFTGLRYYKTEGMNNVGKAKNVYTEEYAESDSLRYFLPGSDSAYANEATKITMTFIILGDAASRQTTYNNFVDYVRKGVHKYWDTARNREFSFIVTEEIKPSDEKWHGSQPYIEVEVPMQNLSGKTIIHTT